MLDRQLDVLQAAGCECELEDHAYGATSDRPNLTTCLDYPRRSAVLVTSISIGSSKSSSPSSTFSASAASNSALKSTMDTTTPAGWAFQQIQAAVTEMEGDVIHQRVRDGINAVGFASSGENRYAKRSACGRVSAMRVVRPARARVRLSPHGCHYPAGGPERWLRGTLVAKRGSDTRHRRSLPCLPLGTTRLPFPPPSR